MVEWEKENVKIAPIIILSDKTDRFNLSGEIAEIQKDQYGLATSTLVEQISVFFSTTNYSEGYYRGISYPLENDKYYLLKVDIKRDSGDIFQQEIFKFHTIDKFKITEIFPTQIEESGDLCVRFNYLPNQESFVNNALLNGVVTSNWSFNENLACIHVNSQVPAQFNLQISTSTYSDLAGNLDRDYTHTLSASPNPIQVILLPVSFYWQPYFASCVPTDIKMALSAYGIVPNEWEITSLIGYAQPTVKTYNEDGSILWGDPYLGFVGRLDGGSREEAAGVFLPVSVNAVKYYRPASEYLYSQDWSSALGYVVQGYPVIYVFDQAPGLILQCWQTGVSNSTFCARRLHARTIVGVTRNKFTGEYYSVRVYDSLYGDLTLDINTFIYTFNTWDRGIIVIR